MQTILWHDYETTGADPSVDRPTQFACIRTNLELEPVEDPVTLFCRLPADCVPHPEACLVTGLSPSAINKKGLPEPEFVARIAEIMSVPNSCAAGYNSIRFDDEITRFSFYRNFIDPYAREWKQGNSRWDIIDMVRMTYLLRPETLIWPLRDDSVVSFRLEQLSLANGVSHLSAHDALSDVEATIGIARIIRREQPKLYDYYWQSRQKPFVQARIDIDACKPFLHVSSRFSASRGCAALMAPLARLKNNRNAIVAVDLAWCPEDLKQMAVADIRERVFLRSVEGGDESRIPLKLVHLNRVPVILPPSMLSDERAAEIGLDINACQENWRKLQEFDFHKLDWDEIFAWQGDTTRDDETALYSGFISPADQAKVGKIPQMLEDELRISNFGFADARLDTLLFRYRARNWPESLSTEESLQWRDWVATKLESGQPFGLPVGECLQLIDSKLEQDLMPQQKTLLLDLKDYILTLRSRWARA